jgi:hypothetical protein
MWIVCPDCARTFVVEAPSPCRSTDSPGTSTPSIAKSQKSGTSIRLPSPMTTASFFDDVRHALLHWFAPPPPDNPSHRSHALSSDRH